jgi:hypothetical protein
MSKLDEKLAIYADMLTKMGHKVDQDLLKGVTKACGPSIYNNDGETVSSSSESELETVKNNFIVKKLGEKNDATADKAIAKVVEDFGSENRHKYRAVFYYLLAKAYKKESQFK